MVLMTAGPCLILVHDIGIGSVLLCIILMAGTIIGIGAVSALYRYRKRLADRKAGRLPAEDDAEEESEGFPRAEGEDAGEQTWTARWVACLGADLASSSGMHELGAEGSRPRPKEMRPLTRGLVITAIAVGIIAVGYAFKSLLRSSPQKEAKDVIVLTSIDKWVDSISMFEDKVRIRFHYRNTTNREVDAFNVYFHLLDTEGDTLIIDYISIANRVGSNQVKSWTQEYWATCPQGFNLAAWDALVHKDITDFKVEWFPVGLIFSDGEAIR